MISAISDAIYQLVDLDGAAIEDLAIEVSDAKTLRRDVSRLLLADEIELHPDADLIPQTIRGIPVTLTESPHPAGWAIVYAAKKSC